MASCDDKGSVQRLWGSVVSSIDLYSVNYLSGTEFKSSQGPHCVPVQETLNSCLVSVCSRKGFKQGLIGKFASVTIKLN